MSSRDPPAHHAHRHATPCQGLASAVNVPLIENTIPNVSLDTTHLDKGAKLPTIQPTSPNKGATTATTAHTHASITASSGSSTTDSLSELTSHSSWDSLPVAQLPSGTITPQKQARSNRRSKSGKPNAKWSRGGGSSDDTRPDRTPPTSQPAEAALNAAQSPTPTHKQRQPHSTSRNPAVKQERLMATTFGSPSGDSRRGVASPRPKGRGMRLMQREVVVG